MPRPEFRPFPPSSAARDAVLPHLAMEIGAVDAEPRGRLGDVPVRALERAPHRLGLAALDLAAQAGPFAALGAALEPGREVLCADLVTRNQDGGALHEVLELAHVAGPVVPADQALGLRGEALGGLRLGLAAGLEKS